MITTAFFAQEVLMILVASVLIAGWLLASTIGSWAYFAGDVPHNSELKI
jgi:hypothetical protein